MLCLDKFSGSFEQKVIQLYQMFKQYNLKSDEDKRTSREVDVQYDYTPTLVKKRISATVAYQISLQKGVFVLQCGKRKEACGLKISANNVQTIKNDNRALILNLIRKYIFVGATANIRV